MKGKHFLQKNTVSLPEKPCWKRQFLRVVRYLIHQKCRVLRRKEVSYMKVNENILERENFLTEDRVGILVAEEEVVHLDHEILDRRVMNHLNRSVSEVHILLPY